MPESPQRTPPSNESASKQKIAFPRYSMKTLLLLLTLASVFFAFYGAIRRTVVVKDFSLFSSNLHLVILAGYFTFTAIFTALTAWVICRKGYSTHFKLFSFFLFVVGLFSLTTIFWFLNTTDWALKVENDHFSAFEYIAAFLYCFHITTLTSGLVIILPYVSHVGFIENQRKRLELKSLSQNPKARKQRP